MHTLKERLLILVIFISIIALTHPLSVSAQTQDIRLTTSPLPINLSTLPGEPVSTELRVRNSGSQTETLAVGLLKFSPDDQTGLPQLMERQPGDDYFDWVSFSPNHLTLAPNEWGSTTMTINPPKSAAFGYYYAATFSRADDTVQAPFQAKLVGATATLVLLDVYSPDAKRQMRIESFRTDRPWYEFLPVGFTVGVQNQGNVHGVAAGTIFISQQGQAVATLPVNDARGNILPTSSREFGARWADGFGVYQDKQVDKEVIYKANGQPEQQLTWDFSQANKLRWGKYTAEVVLAYDNGQRDVPMTATVEFWVIPWRVALMAIAIPVLPAILVFIFMKLKHRREMNEDRV